MHIGGARLLIVACLAGAITALQAKNPSESSARRSLVSVSYTCQAKRFMTNQAAAPPATSDQNLTFKAL